MKLLRWPFVPRIMLPKELAAAAVVADVPGAMVDDTVPSGAVTRLLENVPLSTVETPVVREEVRTAKI